MMEKPSHQKVAYVVKRYPRYSETFIVNEVLAHEAAGVPIEIFSLFPPNDTHFQNSISRVRAPVHYLPCDGPKAVDLWNALQEVVGRAGSWERALTSAQGEAVRDVYQALMLARAVRARGIGHLHAHFATAATTVARLAAAFAGISYSFTAHAKDIFHESVQADDLQTKMQQARAVVTVSDFNVEHLRAQFGASAQTVVRVYNGLDLSRFPFAPPADRERRIVAVGRLVEKKGFNILVEACALLAQRGVDFHCEIIGGGEMERALRQQITERGLQTRVLLTGPRPQRDIISDIQRASVFAAPCVVGEDGNRDGLPTVLLEAMALGTPCVSTDVTGIPEVLRPDATGLLVPQHDAVALATSMERLLDDSALRVRLAGAARQLIESQFDVHRNAALQRELCFTRVDQVAVL
jgi:colanic acid/amylovoran biosynthesis glycosyltransferase